MRVFWSLRNAEIRSKTFFVLCVFFFFFFFFVFFWGGGGGVLLPEPYSIYPN